MKRQRQIPRVLCLAIVGWCLALPAAFATTDLATLTVGSSALTTCGSSKLVDSGYPWPSSAYSPSTLTGGNAVIAVYDVTCGSPFNPPFLYAINSNLVIGGFSSDPGKSWLTSVSCNGVTETSASATGYGYNASTGRATWNWSTTFGLWWQAPGVNVSCSIVH